jgi:hypothetical protein
MTFNQSDINRFFLKVNKIPGGCWLWLAQKDELGYGKFKVNKKNLLAHRFSYEIHKGQIPTGMEICHHCDVPSCVHPDHLFAGTHADNILDRTAKGRNILFSGERGGNHKLTASQVLQIRELQLSSEAIARMFHISPTQVKRIKKFQQWKHLKVFDYRELAA